MSNMAIAAATPDLSKKSAKTAPSQLVLCCQEADDAGSHCACEHEHGMQTILSITLSRVPLAIRSCAARK